MIAFSSRNTVTPSHFYTSWSNGGATTATNFDAFQGGFAMPTRAADRATELVAVARRRLGRYLDAKALRDWRNEWTKAAKSLVAYLRQLDERDEAVRGMARHMRLREPRRPPLRSRVRTCGASSSRSARPPEAIS